MTSHLPVKEIGPTVMYLNVDRCPLSTLLESESVTLPSVSTEEVLKYDKDSVKHIDSGFIMVPRKLSGIHRTLSRPCEWCEMCI